ncbi:hypothetical protein PH7735_02671 [Shimia thalassica]|uniref:Uncharacterized protein n=1 Tax=Shimia thalassica TaxID=1715693 RepID=A0A0N7M9T0_9RHOB|nr:hypothetical protein PH7735_02671 [Shimia thalassica]
MVAGFQRRDAFAHFHNDTSAFMTKDRGKKPFRICARAGELIRVTQARGLDFD